MLLTKPELRALIKACKALGCGKDYRRNDYILNLHNTVLDFQMNLKVVNASMDHFSTVHGIKQHAALRRFLDRFPNTKTGNRKLANALWDNNHWTRAQFLRRLLTALDQRGIHSQITLERWARAADFHQDVKGQFKTKHHSIGYAMFKWLQLRVGVDTVKPDLHVRAFVKEAIGRSVSPDECVKALLAVSKHLQLKAHRLDAAIWEHQRNGA